MSGSSYRNYGSSHDTVRRLTSDDADERKRAEDDRRLRVASARSDIDRGHIAKPVARDEREVYKPSAVKPRITRPSDKAQRLDVLVIDNSASNELIAKHMKATSGYLLSMHGGIDPGSQIATIYFSDHYDGDLLMQEVDYVSPDEDGDSIMHSTTSRVRPAHGGDCPEAIECALWRACDLDFGHVPKEGRFLYLVTDDVAHGMGGRGDNGCPFQRDWRRSAERVGETYGGFTLVSCSDDRKMAARQAPLLPPERVAYDLLDLSEISDNNHRKAITGNALLFLIARNRGMQAVSAFLMALYEKWLKEPIFGQASTLKAKEAVRRFLQFLEISDDEREKLADRIFAD